VKVASTPKSKLKDHPSPSLVFQIFAVTLHIWKVSICYLRTRHFCESRSGSRDGRLIPCTCWVRGSLSPMSGLVVAIVTAGNRTVVFQHVVRCWLDRSGVCHRRYVTVHGRWARHGTHRLTCVKVTELGPSLTSWTSLVLHFYASASKNEATVILLKDTN
jgi:hypothetical protein